MKIAINNEWHKLSNFILKQDKDVFRQSLSSINRGLYLELQNAGKPEIKNKSRKELFFLHLSLNIN